jgi:uncharacterized protein with NRDE domain
LRRRSRGQLVLDFLASNLGPIEFATQLQRDGGRYAGFNLVVGDICVGSASAYYVTNHQSSQVLRTVSHDAQHPTRQLIPHGKVSHTTGHADRR